MPCAGSVCVLSWSLGVPTCIRPIVVGKLFPGHYPPPLALVTFLLPLPNRPLSPEKGGLIKTSHLGLSALKSVTLCTIQVRISVICGLLQEGPSPMKGDKRSAQRYELSHF